MYWQNALETIKSLELIPYRLNFVKASYKDIVICIIRNTNDEFFYSEVSPLKGFSQENFEQAYQQLLHIKHLIAKKELIDERKLFPSVHFALTAPFPQKAVLEPQAINALYTGNFEELIKNKEAIRKQGFTHLKFKIAGFNQNQITYSIKELAQDFSLRIDANRFFTFLDAKKYFCPLASFIDYVEEPTFELNRLADLNLPVGLDESLRENLILSPLIAKLKAFIIKPTLMGGPNRWPLLIEKAKTLNIPLVFSSSYESSIGLRQISYLSQSIQSPHTVLGLDTYKYLLNDVVQSPLELMKGYFVFPSSIKIQESLCPIS